LGWLISHEAEVFLCIYFGSILLVATGEAFVPRRALHPGMGSRWSHTILLHLIDVGLVRWLYPLIGVGVAIWTAERGYGLLNLLYPPAWLAWALTFLALDLAYYVQHRLLHQVPLLWRLHRVHHTDRDYDFSTGLRFHPLEAVFTTGFGLAVVVALGPPPEAAALYGFIHLGWSLFAHANLRLPLPADRALRRALVTPDLHRTHHSAAPGEAMTNFGAVMPLWDRLFGTYLDQPALGHTDMVIGLPAYRDARHQRLGDMLLQPFLAEPDAPEASPRAPAEGQA
jgi:sterol desaturase/sphingolipid hydroxylase (fatty acid hydroxylase superfamily)